MAYMHRPYGGNYCESDRAIIREAPYGGSYDDARYTVDEYGNRVYQHRNGLGNTVTDVVTEVIPGGHSHNYGHHHNYDHHHQHYGRPAEIIERREERIIDGAYDPCRRIY